MHKLLLIIFVCLFFFAVDCSAQDLFEKYTVAKSYDTVFYSEDKIFPSGTYSAIFGDDVSIDKYLPNLYMSLKDNIAKNKVIVELFRKKSGIYTFSFVDTCLISFGDSDDILATKYSVFCDDAVVSYIGKFSNVDYYNISLVRPALFSPRGHEAEEWIKKVLIPKIGYKATDPREICSEIGVCYAENPIPSPVKGGVYNLVVGLSNGEKRLHFLAFEQGVMEIDDSQSLYKYKRHVEEAASGFNYYKIGSVFFLKNSVLKTVYGAFQEAKSDIFSLFDLYVGVCRKEKKKQKELDKLQREREESEKKRRELEKLKRKNEEEKKRVAEREEFEKKLDRYFYLLEKVAEYRAPHLTSINELPDRVCAFIERDYALDGGRDYIVNRVKEATKDFNVRTRRISLCSFVRSELELMNYIPLSCGLFWVHADIAESVAANIKYTDTSSYEFDDPDLCNSYAAGLDYVLDEFVKRKKNNSTDVKDRPKYITDLINRYNAGRKYCEKIKQVVVPIMIDNINSLSIYFEKTLTKSSAEKLLDICCDSIRKEMSLIASANKHDIEFDEHRTMAYFWFFLRYEVAKLYHHDNQNMSISSYREQEFKALRSELDKIKIDSAKVVALIADQ